MPDNFTTFVIMIVIILCVYIYYQNQTKDLTSVVSSLDGRKYLVRNLPDKERAANMLAKIRQNMIVLMNHLLKNYPDRECVALLKSRFDPDKVMETAQGEKYTSYTINKGEKMVLCIRARDGTNALEEENTMMFVSLHEMAHIMTKSVGHEDDEFWKNFKFALQNAQELGLYKSVDYRVSPQSYCGMQITDNPLNDSSIEVEK